MTLDNLKCVFEYVEANRTDFELRLWNYQRVSRRPPSLPPSLPPFLQDWYKGGKIDDLSGEFGRYKPVPEWDACFPDVVALASTKG